MKSNSILLVAAVVLSLPLTAQAQLPTPSPEGQQVAPLGAVPDGTWDASSASFLDPSCVDGVSCAGMVDPSCTDGIDGSPRCRRCWDLWGSAEVLLWWMKGSSLPPIVGTSPTNPLTPRIDASVVGTPGYTTLYGDERVGREIQAGGRITLGTWLDATHNAGIGMRFFALDGSSEHFDQATGGDPIIGRPYYNVLLGRNDAQLVGYPNELAGDIHVKFINSLIGNDAYFRVMLERSRLRRLDFISGYQFLRMDDGLQVSSTTNIIDPNSLIFGAQFNITDRFRATNEFHGAMMGLQGTMGRGNWSLTGLGKLGIGNNHQQVIIQGVRDVSFPPGPATTFPAGLLAQPSNIGTHIRDRICFIPEMTLNLAYHIRPTVSVHVGYNLIWMSDVVLSGDQIDLRVNTSQVPGPVVGPNLPAFQFRSTEYWVQGINLGVNWNF